MRKASSLAQDVVSKLNIQTEHSITIHLSDTKIAAKLRTAIVINITVLAGMFVRNSIISLLRYSCDNARNKNTATCEHVPRRPRKAARCDLRVNEYAA